MPEQIQERPLFTVAAEIRRTWNPVDYCAVPYVEAMERLNLITDRFGEDSARTVVAYFISNAKRWSGPDAHRIKNELRAMIGQKLAPAPKFKAPADTASAAARDERKVQAAIVRGAVVRAIFCPYTGVVLDMRRAVVVDTGTRSFVLTATHWDEIKDDFYSHVGPDVAARVKVYDGRELFTPSGRVR